jgi:hypothetical protein
MGILYKHKQRETKIPSQNKMTNYKIQKVEGVEKSANGNQMVNVINMRSGKSHVGFISKNGKVEIFSGMQLKKIKI